MQAILVILAIVVFIQLVIMALTFAQVRLMSNASLVPSSDAEPPADADQWARSNNFEFVGNFTMKFGSMDALISTWRQSDRPTFFCQYVIRSGDRAVKRAYDLVTEFAFDISLTTADTRDGFSFPRPPGSYLQSFSNMGFDDRWYEHIEMENYLIDNGHAQLVQHDKPFEKCIVDAIRKQMNYVRSLTLWPLRAAYWYFIRRRLWYNKSIKTQHENRMIKLPNELSGPGLVTPISPDDHF